MNALNRRAFLLSAAAASLSPAWADSPEGLHLTPPPKGHAAEAERITQATMRQFWDPKAAMFKAPVLSAEALQSDPEHDRGYVFWPSQIALHSLVEGAKSQPKKYAPQIWTVYQGLEKYYDAERHAYDAWLHFPENNDAYYDDNAWAVITLAEASMATAKIDPDHAKLYRERAIEIMSHFMYGGWDDTGKPGGERWGTDPTKHGTADKTVSATAGAALAALTLARAGWNVQFNVDWSASVLAWIWSRLRDKDDLILDGLRSPDWSIMPTKWTYNTGVPMRAYAEHYRLSHDSSSLENATALARASLDHTSRLYDGAVKDPAKRFFYDSTFFVHFLLDGLLQVAEVTPDAKLAVAIRTEGRREANYAYNYIRDKVDGFYWRNWRLWCIGPTQLAEWERMTGQTIALNTDASEKSMDGKRWAKTLLANAAAARLFWIAARF